MEVKTEYLLDEKIVNRKLNKALLVFVLNWFMLVAVVYVGWTWILGLQVPLWKVILLMLGQMLLHHTIYFTTRDKEK